jgi:hypothetical protein
VIWLRIPNCKSSAVAEVLRISRRDVERFIEHDTAMCLVNPAARITPPQTVLTDFGGLYATRRLVCHSAAARYFATEVFSSIWTCWEPVMPVFSAVSGVAVWEEGQSDSLGHHRDRAAECLQSNSGEDATRFSIVTTSQA